METTSHRAPPRTSASILSGLRGKTDLWIALGLALLGLFTRIPFVGNYLYHWDSINFAYSLEKFDIALGQPHFPGYILYVYLGRLVALYFQDAQLTLVAISLLSSGFSIGLLFILGRFMYSRWTGVIAALFLTTSPLFWFYGEIALPHSLDALVVILAALLLYLVMTGKPNLLIPTAIWLGICGGLRPQTQVFLLPLAIYATWQIPWKKRMTALGVLVLVNLAWLIPLFQLNGGFLAYFQGFQDYYLSFNQTTSVVSGGGLAGILRNLRKLGMYTLYGWSLAILPALIGLIYGGAELIKRGLRLKVESRFWFLAIWILPALAYYVFIHMGQQGLVFVFLPALFLLSAQGLVKLMNTRPTLATVCLAAILIGNSLIFLALPTYPLQTDRVKLLTVDTLNRHEDYYRDRLDLVQKSFPSSSTVVLSSQWRFPQYYLSDYAYLTYDIIPRWEQREGQTAIFGETTTSPGDFGLSPNQDGLFHLVIFDEDLRPFNASPDRVEYLPEDSGRLLPFITLNPTEQISRSSEYFKVTPGN